MQGTKRKSSILSSILKILAIILLIIVVFVIMAYCFLRFSLGIDLIDIKRKLDLLRAPVSESAIITKPFNDQDAIEAFSKMFGTNTIYQEKQM